MNLILQCAVCGTSHPVGSSICSTCRATGLTDLRLLFECPKCFRLGLLPACSSCSPAPDPAAAEEPTPVLFTAPETASTDLEDDGWDVELVMEDRDDGFTFEPEEPPPDDNWDFELDLEED